MLAQLLPKGSQNPITLDKDITLVGRKHGLCDLVLDHKGISKLQAILIKTDGLLYLRDLCSTNGTRVNGTRVIRGALLPGDTVSFANRTFTVILGPDPDSSDDVRFDTFQDENGLKIPPEVANGNFDGDLEELESLAEMDSDSDVRLLED